MEASDRVRLNTPEQVFTQLGFEIADLHPTAIREAHQQRLEAFRQMLDTTRLRAFADLGPIGIPLEPEITPRFRTKIESALTGFGAEIGQTFARALEGGGGFLGAAQSLGVQGGNRLGDALSGGLAKKMTAETGFFSKGIGSFFGKAMGQAIPFIGPFVGLGIGKIFGAFKKPSEAELAARQQVADYQHTIIEGLSSSQLSSSPRSRSCPSAPRKPSSSGNAAGPTRVSWSSLKGRERRAGKSPSSTQVAKDVSSDWAGSARR